VKAAEKMKKTIPRLAAALFFGRQLPLVRGSLRLRGLLTMQLPQRRLCFIYLALNISLIIIEQQLFYFSLRQITLRTTPGDSKTRSLGARAAFAFFLGIFTRMRSSASLSSIYFRW
jgi:hypothetical protein